MSIIQDLEQILSARYGRDVRQAIHDSIEEGYNIAVQAEDKATTAQDSAQASASASAQSSASALQSAQLAEQYKNEAFSGTPTGYETLVEKVNSIYKETASNYAVVGTSEGSALAHTIYGMSEQDGTPTPDNPVEIESAVANFKCVGKNLIPFPATYLSSNNPRTINGVTFEQFGDGSIKATGTATTSNANLYLTDWRDGNLSLIKAGTYTLKGCPSGGSMETYGIGFYAYEVGKSDLEVIPNVHKWDTGTGRTFTLDTDCWARIYVSIVAGATAPSAKFYPQLVLESAQDQTYEPYHSTSVTTDLTLRALEVTSSDDYNLVKDGKYYVADTVDWSEDNGYVITRRVGHGMLSDYIIGYSSGTPNVFICRMGKAFVGSSRSAIASNKYHNVYANKNPLELIDGDAKHWVSNDNQWGFKNSNYSNMQEARTGEANTIVDFILATPTTEPITSQQAQALLSLKTYDEATSITAESDIEPTMVLEYSKDRNTALALTGHNVAYKNALRTEELNIALMEFTAGQEA